MLRGLSGRLAVKSSEWGARAAEAEAEKARASADRAEAEVSVSRARGEKAILDEASSRSEKKTAESKAETARFAAEEAKSQAEQARAESDLLMANEAKARAEAKKARREFGESEQEGMEVEYWDDRRGVRLILRHDQVPPPRSGSVDNLSYRRFGRGSDGGYRVRFRVGARTYDHEYPMHDVLFSEDWWVPEAAPSPDL